MGVKGEGNRQRIIDAADNLFYRRGYNQTSFQDISEATGIPRGNFYYYFKTKDEILDAVVDSRIADISTMLKNIETQTDDARERLVLFTNMLQFKRDDLIESGCPAGTLSSELSKDSPALQLKSRQAFITMRDWLKLQLDKLEITGSENLAMDLLAKLQGVTVLGCAFKDAGYIERAHQEIKDWLSVKTQN